MFLLTHLLLISLLFLLFILSFSSQVTHVTPFFTLPDGGVRPIMAPQVATSDMLSSLSWNHKSEYYYRDVKERIKSIISTKCHQYINYINGKWNNDVNIFSTTLSRSESIDKSSITVLSLTPNNDIQQFWKQLPPPIQMRTDIGMCNDTWYHKKSIFRSHYSRICDEVLHKGAPRCQPKYLEMMCYLSMADVESTSINHFYLPESNHMTTFTPSIPYLIQFRNARVAVCGQISLSCGKNDRIILLTY